MYICMKFNASYFSHPSENIIHMVKTDKPKTKPGLLVTPPPAPAVG